MRFNFSNRLKQIRSFVRRFWVVIVFLVGFFADLDSSLGFLERLKVFSKKKSKSAIGFPITQNRDSLFVLVTRFENFDSLHPTSCFGRFLVSRINHNAEKDTLPIRAMYITDAPLSSKDADILQGIYNADITLWGSIQNLKETCSEGDICFKSNASQLLVNLAGGSIGVSNTEVIYQKGLTPSDIEFGNFHIKDKRFDSWLLSVYNLKVGLANPDLYIVDSTLTDNEKSDSYVEKSYLFVMLKKPELALLNVSEALKYNSRNINALNHRANLYYERKDFERSLRDLDYSISLNPSSGTIAVRGLVKMSMGVEEATLDFNKAIHLRMSELKITSLKVPIDTSSRNWLSATYRLKAFIYSDFNKHDLAIQSLDSALVLGADLHEILNNRAFEYSHLKRLNYALNDYNAAIRVKPSGEAYRSRATVLVSLGRMAEALRDLNTAISISPSYAEVYIDRGKIKEQQDDVKGALRDYDYAISLAPAKYRAFIARGFLRLSMYDNWGAVSDFEKSIKLRPAFPITSKSYLALAYLNARDYMGVLDATDWDFRFKNNAAELYYYRGVAFLEMKDTLQSIRSFDRVIAMDSIKSDGLNSMEKLIHIYYYKKEYKKALNLLNKLVILRPKHYLYHLASKINLLSGDYTAALNWVNKAIMFDLTAEESYILRMQIYQMINRDVLPLGIMLNEKVLM